MASNDSVSASIRSRTDGAGRSGAIARHIAALPDTLPLILAGREIGDCDDGLLAPLLSAGLDRRFFGLAQEVRLEGGRVSFVRERGACHEVAVLAADLLVSVTNDRRNKLRRPLMKNVQAAKRATYPLAPTALPEGAGAALRKTSLRANARHPIACRKLEGPLHAQVTTLAEALKESARL